MRRTAIINLVETTTNVSYTPASTSQQTDTPAVAGGYAAACPEPAKSVFEMSGDWSVVVVKTNYERRLSAELSIAGVDHFLPLIEQEHRTPAGRRVVTKLPLFPTYLFLCGDVHARDIAHRSRSTISIIEPPRPRKLFQELAAIERALHENRTVGLYPGLVVGRKCQVKAGHKLEGTTGKLSKRDDGRSVFVVEIEMLGQGIELEISPTHLEPV